MIDENSTARDVIKLFERLDLWWEICKPWKHRLIMARFNETTIKELWEQTDESDRFWITESLYRDHSMNDLRSTIWFFNSIDEYTSKRK